MTTYDTSDFSVQLYSVREALAADLPGTLERLAGFGYRRVEPFAFTTFPGLGAALAGADLSAPTAHAHLIGADAAAVVDAAAELGIGTVYDPFTPPERWASSGEVRRLADEFNALAAQAAAVGVRIGYHNHAHELEPEFDGVTALEVFAAALDPSVSLQIDTYWAAVAGRDVPALLGRLGDRVSALHIKDGPGSHDDTEQVAVGDGLMPIADFLSAAPHALPVVELDDSAGDRMIAVERSLRFLEALERP